MTECIVRMELPKNCVSCPIAHWNKVNELTGCDAAGGKRYIPMDDEFWNLDRPSWCPIIGVLPEQHGDLIDRDALLDKYNVKGTNIAECLTDKKMARAFERYCIIADAVEAVEAVIAAERKDDGTTAD